MKKRCVTIIDKSKRSPYFVWKPRPTFRSIYEEQKYFAEEKTKWIEGVGEVPGSLYFYLQECFIKHRIVPSGHESIERPAVRVASLLIHQAIQQTSKEKKVQGIFKGRGVGLSTEGGGLCNYYAKVHPGSNCIVTSKDQDGIAILFREKIYIPYQHMDKKIRPDELRKSDTKQHCHLRLGVHHMGIGGDEKYSTSTIELRETSNRPTSPQNFSGQGAAFGFYDEFMLHPRKEELLNSSIECLRDPFTKELTGLLLFGGTFEDSMSNEDISGFQKIIENKDIWNCNILFLPFFMSMFLDEAGYPDEKKAYEWWNREYEKIDKDTARARAFIRNNPRTMDDIFDSIKGGRWEDETAEILTLQKQAVIKADVPCPKYNITGLGTSAVAEKNNHGHFWMLEQPKQNCKYISLIDGIATGTEFGSADGSKMASIIVKVVDPVGDQYMPVNIYEERPKTVEAGYRRIVAQMNYYNMYGGMHIVAPEANAATIETFSVFLLKDAPHLFKLLAKRLDFSGKGFVDTKKLGQFRTPQVIAFQYAQANVFIRKYFHSLQMLPLIDAMLTGVDKDSHILDAWLQFFTAMPEYDKERKPTTIRKITTTTLVYENGRTFYKTVTV